MTQLSINTTWYLSLYTIHRRQKCNVKWSLFYLVAQIYLWSIRRGEIKVLTSAPVSYFIWSSLFAPLDTWLGAIRIYWPRSNYLNTFSNFWILNWPRSVNHGSEQVSGWKESSQVAHVLLANHFLPPSRHSRLTSFMNLRITDRELPSRRRGTSVRNPPFITFFIERNETQNLVQLRLCPTWLRLPGWGIFAAVKDFKVSG